MFVPLLEGKTVKNRLHIDLAPAPDGDQAAEVRRLEALGARLVDVGQDSGTASWVVMADPPMPDPPMAGTFSAESRLIHAGTDRTAGRPATPPLAPASIYVSAGPPRPGRAYGRDGNPGWEGLEQALGGLEDAEAVAFASGQAKPRRPA